MKKSIMKQHGIDNNRLAKKMKKAGSKNNIKTNINILSDAEIKERKKLIEEILRKNNISLTEEFKLKKTETFEEKMERLTLFCFDTYIDTIKFWENDAKAFNSAASYAKVEELESKFEKFIDDEENNKVLVKNNKL